MQPRRLRYFPRKYALNSYTHVYTHTEMPLTWPILTSLSQSSFSLTYIFSFPCGNLLSKFWVFFKVQRSLTSPCRAWSPIIPFLYEILPLTVYPNQSGIGLILCAYSFLLPPKSRPFLLSLS